MLLLRLTLMILLMILIMEHHPNVNSSTTGIRKNMKQEQSVKLNVDAKDRRKKKKPKKGKKPKSKKGKKPKPKPKPSIVTSAPTKLPETTPETITPGTAATDPPTTTAPTTTDSTTPDTTAPVTTDPPTTTAPETTDLPTTSTSPMTSAGTTSAASSGKDCKATNGSPCIFPFKDGGTEHSVCANEGGRYFWCATSVTSTGAYRHWSYCPKDKSCPLQGDDGGCTAKNGFPCLFPFTNRGKEYNTCYGNENDYRCATFKSSKGKLINWDFCPTDGSCPLEGQTTSAQSTSTPIPTAVSTTGTAGTSPVIKAIADVENIVTEIATILQTSTPEGCKSETTELSENENKLLQIMADLIIYMESSCMNRTCDPEKLNTFVNNLKSAIDDIKTPEKRNPNDLSYGIYYAFEKKQTVITEMSWRAKIYQVKVGDGLTLNPFTVDYIGSVDSVFDCCSHCREKYTSEDTELCDDYKPLFKCNCYKTIPGVAPETWQNSDYISDVCDLCPPHYDYKNGYEKRTYKTSLGDYRNVPSMKECEAKCIKLNCLTFIYSSKDKTCELNSIRVTSPSQPRYLDYRMCVMKSHECCGSCSITHQKNFGSSSTLRVVPPVPFGRPADWFYAENHGLFIIKMFQEMHMDTGVPGLPPAPYMPPFHYIPGGMMNFMAQTALLDPYIGAYVAGAPGHSGVYLFFLGPANNDIVVNGPARPAHLMHHALPLPAPANQAENLWTNIFNIPFNAAHQGAVNNNQVPFFPFYVGKTNNLCRRYNEHVNTNNEAFAWWQYWRGRGASAGIGPPNLNYHLYFTYALTNTLSKATILEKVLLDSFDFPNNVYDNDLRRRPLTIHGANTLALDKYAHVKDKINHVLLGSIDQTLDFLYPFPMLADPRPRPQFTSHALN